MGAAAFLASTTTRNLATGPHVVEATRGDHGASEGGHRAGLRKQVYRRPRVAGKSFQSSILKFVLVLGALLAFSGIARAQPVYCQGSVGSTSFDATGAVTVNTTLDLNTALGIATATPCTSVITVGAAGTFQLTQTYIVPTGSALASTFLTLQAGSGLGPNDVILQAASDSRHFECLVGSWFALTGITLTGGDVHSLSQAQYGGAVSVSGNFTAANCYFRNNQAGNGGAVNVNGGATFTASSCSFISNKAKWEKTWIQSNSAVGKSTSGDEDGTDGGGALIIYGGWAYLTDCEFTSNESTAGDRIGAAAGGGAITSSGGNVICTNCTFTSNSANNNGGAVLNYNYNSKLNHFFNCYGCKFWSNSAGQGGAIWSRVGNGNCNANDPTNLPCSSNGLTLMYCQWWGNSVTRGNYETRGSNIFLYGSQGCWCTYLDGTSPPGYQDKKNTGGINNYKQCVCNAAAAPTPVPAGDNVGLSAPFSGGNAVTVNFTKVVTQGIMNLMEVSYPFLAADDPYNPPNINFIVGDLAAYFNVHTTATFTGPVTVCLSYPIDSIGVSDPPRLFHYESDWKDTTKIQSVGNGAQVVCGTVNSFSPFAAGIPQRPLVLKRLKLSKPTNSRDGGGKDSWSLQAKLDLSVVASTFLADVDEQGIAFELGEAPTGSIDTVTFTGEDCNGGRQRHPTVKCKLKNGNFAVEALFKREGSIKANKSVFAVSAKFDRRQFNLTAPSLRALAPLEVRITTPTRLGIATASATKCRASKAKVSCAH